MSRRQQATMVLPHVDDHGYADDAWARSLGDVRVPTPLTYDAEVRTYSATERCTDDRPRHLWDILESAEWREVETDAGEWVEEASYREVLTCVRCGRVVQREGIRRERRRGHLEVEPLRAGQLRAVQVKVENFFAGDDASYVVVDVDDLVVGRICWARGPRGRRHYVGVLGDAHPRVNGTEVVEGPSPNAVLRKLDQASATVGRGCPRERADGRRPDLHRRRLLELLADSAGRLRDCTRCERAPAGHDRDLRQARELAG